MSTLLRSQKVRVLVPLVGVSTFAAASFGNLLTMAFGLSHHFFWREMVFGSCLITLTAVTGLKGRQG
jgi:hypothetical protein